MRKVIVIGTALALASGTAWAGAKDKTSNTLIDLNGAGIISNTLAKTKIKSKGCKLQIQAKDVTMADGDIAICTVEADALVMGSMPGNSLVFTGEAKNSKFKLKADLTEAQLLGQGCGDVEALSINGRVRCYLDDPAYRADSGVGSWREACVGAGMVAGASPAADADMLKANPTVPVVIGICQGTIDGGGERIPPPSSTEWGETGQRTAIIIP